MERISATEMPDSNAGANAVLREKGEALLLDTLECRIEY